jgi:hypothetical protein
MGSLTNEQFVSRFFEIEQEFNLFSFRVKGRAIWDYLRYPIFYELLKRVVRSNEISFRSQKVSRLQREFLAFVPVLLRSIGQRWNTKEYELLVINYDRKKRIESEGLAANIHFYPVIKEFSSRYRTLLLDPSTYEERIENLYPCDVIRSRIFHHKAAMQSRLVFYNSKDRKTIDCILGVLERKFQVTLNRDRLIRNYFSYQLCLSREYSRIFERFRPRLILHADTGNCKGWIEAAHKAGIPVVDYQHSLMSRGNILYNYPAIDEVRGLATLSDYIFTFGEFWHDQYQLPAELIPVGFPFLEMEKKAVEHKGLPRKDRIIIISSMYSGKKLERLTLKLSELLPAYEIVYKLRPDEYRRWREVYSAELAGRPNIVVVDSDHPTLYEYFATSTHQVGINSTALIEGMVFGLTTFIFKDGWYSEMRSLIEKEAVFLVDSATQIVERIRRSEDPPGKLDASELCKTSSLHNLQEILEQLLKQSEDEEHPPIAHSKVLSRGLIG